VTTLEDLWLGNFIATCSTMFRRGLIKEMPDWYDGFFPITDWPLHLLNAEHGRIGYINEVMGVYRHHRGGYYSPLSQRQKLMKRLVYRRMNECISAVNGRLRRRFQSSLEWVEGILTGISGGESPLSSRYLRKSRSITCEPRRMPSNAMRLYIPSHPVATALA
jgi:hypothetical protein